MCAVRILSRHFRQSQSSNLCDSELLLLRDILSTTKETPPRQVEALINPKPVIIFTDGACEDDGEVVSHGAVLCDPSNGIREYSGEMVPKKIVSSWRKGGKKQLVGQAEMLPVLASKSHWKNHLYIHEACLLVHGQ